MIDIWVRKSVTDTKHPCVAECAKLKGLTTLLWLRAIPTTVRQAVPRMGQEASAGQLWNDLLPGKEELAGLLLAIKAVEFFALSSSVAAQLGHTTGCGYRATCACSHSCCVLCCAVLWGTASQLWGTAPQRSPQHLQSCGNPSECLACFTISFGVLHSWPFPMRLEFFPNHIPLHYVTKQCYLSFQFYAPLYSYRLF